MDVKPDVMQQLRERYRASFPDKYQQLSQLRQRLARGEPCLPEVRAIAHRLAGSGSSYGWHEISAAADRVEQASDADVPGWLDGLVAAVDRARTGEPAES